MPQLNDTGLVITLTLMNGSTVRDLSGATGTNQFKFEKPSGATDTVTATVVGDGTAGQLTYTTESGDLDEVGEWKIQAIVAGPSLSIRSDVGTFRVRSNI